MEVLQQVAAVCLVVGLAVLAASLHRKGGRGAFAGLRWRGSGTNRMEVVERLMLSPQHSICIIRVDGREVTVGLYPGGITVMDRESGSELK